MQKYQPRIHVVKTSEETKLTTTTTHIFKEAEFMAVTSYKNQQVCVRRCGPVCVQNAACCLGAYELPKKA